MRTIILFFILIIGSTWAEAQVSKYIWVGSTIASGTAIGMDIHSSFGLNEQNPLLGRGAFSAKQASILGGIGAFGITSQYLGCRNGCSKKGYIFLTIANIGSVALHTWAYRHNMHQHDIQDRYYRGLR